MAVFGEGHLPARAGQQRLRRHHQVSQAGLPGEAEGAEEDYQVRVEVDEGQRIIRVIDNGIGMTEEEVKKYINQVAFSGAEEFMQKYQQKQEGEGIIGHFGLGFYRPSWFRIRWRSTA